MAAASTIIAWVKRCSPTQNGGFILVLKRSRGADIGLRVHLKFNPGDCLRLRSRGDSWELVR